MHSSSHQRKSGALVICQRCRHERPELRELLYVPGDEQKCYASSDGSYIDEGYSSHLAHIHDHKIDQKTGKFETRRSLSSPMGLGYEYLSAAPADKVTGIVTRYRGRYDMLEDARMGAKQVADKMAAKSVEAGKYDLVIDPTNLFLTIHESVGHPTELDRVLGYEANYAGTSFLTLDKWQSKNSISEQDRQHQGRQDSEDNRGWLRR
jgi:TldD protein